MAALTFGRGTGSSSSSSIPRSKGETGQLGSVYYIRLPECKRSQAMYIVDNYRTKLAIKTPSM